jgi:hypothetical protein
MIVATSVTATSNFREHKMAGLMKRILKPFRWQSDGVAPMSISSKVCLASMDRFPQTRVEQIAVEMLIDKEQIPLSDLAEQLAEKLYRDELRHGGWAVDLGLLGSNMFFMEVLHELHNGNGGLWKIIESDGER